MSAKQTAKRILLAAAVSWVFFVTLGLFFGACVTGQFSLIALTLPLFVPIALVSGSVVAAAMTPLTFWSLRAGSKNLRVYGPILWITLAAYIRFIVPKAGRAGLVGLLVFAACGVLILGFIPPTQGAPIAGDEGLTNKVVGRHTS